MQMGTDGMLEGTWTAPRESDAKELPLNHGHRAKTKHCGSVALGRQQVTDDTAAQQFRGTIIAE